MESTPESKVTPVTPVRFSCGFRYVVIVLAFFGALCCYMTRASFSVALVAMVNSSHISTTNTVSHNSSCPEASSSSSRNQSAVQLDFENDYKLRQFAETYDWSLETQSYLLSAMFYGCTASQMLSGFLMQRFGIRWLYGITLFISYSLYLITPFATRWSANPIIAIRFVQGFLQGGLLPMQSQVVSFWTPVMERSRAFTFVFNGIAIGTFGGMLVSGILADSKTLGGWPSIFYVFGAAGCLWSMLWMALVTDSPEQHPWVSDSELKRITDGKQNKQSNVPIPWKSFLTCIPLWSTIAAVVGNSVGFFLLMTLMPMYFKEALDFDIKSSGALSALPYVAQCLVSYAASYISDALRRSQKLSITAIRKIMSSLGLFGGGLCFAGIAFAGCRTSLIVVLICLMNGLAGFATCGFLVAVVDLSPTFSGTLSGICHTFGFATATALPYIVAYLTKTGHTVENWRKVFILCSTAMIVAGVQYLLLGSAERQGWDKQESRGTEGCVNPALETEKPEVETTRF